MGHADKKISWNGGWRSREVGVKERRGGFSNLTERGGWGVFISWFEEWTRVKGGMGEES